MKIEITNENLVSYRVSKDFEITFEIQTGKKEKEEITLTLNKWALESDNEIDNDWNFDEESRKIYDQLDEDIQSEIDDFVLEIKL